MSARSTHLQLRVSPSAGETGGALFGGGGRVPTRITAAMTRMATAPSRTALTRPRFGRAAIGRRRRQQKTPGRRTRRRIRTRKGMLLGIGTGIRPRQFVQPPRHEVRTGLEWWPFHSNRLEICEKERHRAAVVRRRQDGARPPSMGLRAVRRSISEGRRGALAREKVVAGCDKRVHLIADESKALEHLGASRFQIEVIRCVAGRREQITGAGRYAQASSPKRTVHVITDTRNYILDASRLIEKPRESSRRHLDRTRVAEHGLLLNMAPAMIIGPRRRAESPS